MKCPRCNTGMITGDVIWKCPYPGAFYPDKAEDSNRTHQMKLLFGSKDAISFYDTDEAWYCPQCKKALVILNTEKQEPH